jgi:hypothetical protein
MKLILITLLFCSSALAALPKVGLILTRTSENAGSGIYQIEQEVQFANGQDTLVLKEIWLIENENNMKLIVTGTKELKEQVAFSVSSTNKRSNEEFIEKYFHIRSPEAYAQILNQMKLVPSNVLAKKVPKNLKDMDYQPEPFVRLSRSGGVVSYAIGALPVQEKDPAGFWIEQDQFVLRKFRLPTEVEVTAERYSSYARGLMFPRTRVVRWGSSQVTIQTISVTPKGKEAWAQFGLKTPAKMEALNNQQAASVVDEFYKRFR